MTQLMFPQELRQLLADEPAEEVRNVWAEAIERSKQASGEIIDVAEAQRDALRQAFDFSDSAEDGASAWEDFAERMKLPQAALNRTDEALIKNEVRMQENAERAGELSEAVEGLREAGIDPLAFDSIPELTSAYDELLAVQERVKQQNERAAESWDNLTDFLLMGVRGLNDAIATNSTYAQLLEFIGLDAARDFRDGLIGAAQAQELLNNAMIAGNIRANGFANALERVNETARSVLGTALNQGPVPPLFPSGSGIPSLGSLAGRGIRTVDFSTIANDPNFTGTLIDTPTKVTGGGPGYTRIPDEAQTNSNVNVSVQIDGREIAYAVGEDNSRRNR